MGTKFKAFQKIQELLPICVAHMEKKRALQKLINNEQDKTAREGFVKLYFESTQELDDLLMKSFLHPGTIKTLLRRAEVIFLENEKRKEE